MLLCLFIIVFSMAGISNLIYIYTYIDVVSCVFEYRYTSIHTYIYIYLIIHAAQGIDKKAPP